MKSLTTILAAAFIAGSATVAMAQASGTSGAGADVNPDRVNKGADTNPTGPGANPAAGNTDAQMKGSAKTGPAASGAMKTAPVAGTPSKDSSTPAQAPTADDKKK
jgi:hypothetical protein